jgi:hypothetical protein
MQNPRPILLKKMGFCLRAECGGAGEQFISVTIPVMIPPSSARGIWNVPKNPQFRCHLVILGQLWGYYTYSFGL